MTGMQKRQMAMFLCEVCGHTETRPWKSSPAFMECHRCAERAKKQKEGRQERLPSMVDHAEGGGIVAQLTTEQLMDRLRGSMSVYDGSMAYPATFVPEGRGGQTLFAPLFEDGRQEDDAPEESRADHEARMRRLITPGR